MKEELFFLEENGKNNTIFLTSNTVFKEQFHFKMSVLPKK